MKCVISGSFHKFYQGIAQTIEELHQCNIEVISPKKSKTINPKDEFVLLETDKTDDIEALEKDHLNLIKEADFLYIYNPEGYIGKSVGMEFGWALALKKPIYSLEKPDDIVLAKFTKVKSPQEICNQYGKP